MALQAQRQTNTMGQGLGIVKKTFFFTIGNWSSFSKRGIDLEGRQCWQGEVEGLPSHTFVSYENTLVKQFNIIQLKLVFRNLAWSGNREGGPNT